MNESFNPDQTRALNFLVVVPKFTTHPTQDYIFPMGIGYIVAAMRQHGLATTVLDLNLYEAPPREVLAEVIRDRSVDVVATGTISAHFNKVRSILEGARAAKPDVLTILGGGVISSEPELMMNALKPDFGILGEGERTIIELAEALASTQNYDHVSGIIFRDSTGKLRTTPPRDAIRELDHLPFPDEELLQGFYKHHAHVYNLVGSRSCPYKCTFCYHPIGDLYRQRSMENLFQEVEESHRKYSPFHYRVIDELFSIRRDRVLEFCRRIKPYKVKWDVQMRVSDVDPELLQIMRDAGCVLISYGLESGSQTVLESMKKHTKVEDLTKAVDWTYEARLQIQGNYIFGDPAETFETAIETFSLWLRQKGKGIFMFPIEVYPGTPLYIDAVKTGLIPDPLSYIIEGCRSINTMRLPDRDALQLLLVMYLLAMTYNRTPCRVLDCRPGTRVPAANGEGRQLYDAKLLCPHCRQEIDYKGLPMYVPQKLSCRHCDRRFDMQPLSQWRHWSSSYQIAHDYQFQASHAEELRKLLHQDPSVYYPAQTPGRMKAHLFGVCYEIPACFTFDQIRFNQIRIFASSEADSHLDPIYIADCNCEDLRTPRYRTHRMERLVRDWQQRNCTVALVGTQIEIQKLMDCTCIRDTRWVGCIVLDATEVPGLTDQGYPVWTTEELSNQPPQVLLIASTLNQRQLCEQYAGLLTQFGTEVTGFYETGAQF